MGEPRGVAHDTGVSAHRPLQARAQRGNRLGTERGRGVGGREQLHGLAIHASGPAARQAVGLLEGRHDWSAFARAGGSHSQSFRRVFAARLVEDGPELEFRIVGDGFLRGMVRALVGSLLWVATGKLSLGRWRELLSGGTRPDAGPSAPARGLMLMRVFYPGEPFPL